MCGACCTNLGPDQSVLLQKEDIEAIARVEKSTFEHTVAQYCEINHNLSTRAGTIILQLKNFDGRCVFLGNNNKCSIHNYKPTQCRIGPERFLPGAMSKDYECMVGVEILENDDQTEQFFSKLMEI